MAEQNTHRSLNPSFSTYIDTCRELIRTRRTDLHQPHADVKRIIDANCPFEQYPSPGIPIRRGALLIHGLLASPFCMREIGQALQAAGILTRAILLPGHGTQPADLIPISYRDWLETVRYGIETLAQEVEHIYLVGYSIGATLAIYQAMQDARIKGIVLLTPAIQIKVPYSVIISWHYLLRKLALAKLWMYRDEEVDYVKYMSLPYNAVQQVIKLTDLIHAQQKEKVRCPVLTISTAQDETISHQCAIDFFKSLPNPNNQLLIYTDKPDKLNLKHAHRYIERMSAYTGLHIKHLSHIGAPFSPTNVHYGQAGDYLYASHKLDAWHKETRFPGYTAYYGAYNQFQADMHAQLFKFGLSKSQRLPLTYNPDFTFMAETIVQFVETCVK